MLSLTTAIMPAVHTYRWLVQHVLVPWALPGVRFPDARTRRKFLDNVWIACYSPLAFGYGLWALYQQSPWWRDLPTCNPFVPGAVPAEIVVLYAIQAAFYGYAVLTLDRKASDFTEYLAHHVITLFLIGGSWALGLVQVGSQIMVLYDFADIWLYSAKSVNYATQSGSSSWNWVADVLLVVFALVFAGTRLVFFPAHIILPCSSSFDSAALLYPGQSRSLAYALKYSMWALWAFQMYWMGLILRAAYRKLVKRVADPEA